MKNAWRAFVGRPIEREAVSEDHPAAPKRLGKYFIGLFTSTVGLGKNDVESHYRRARISDARYEACNGVPPPRPLAVSREAALVDLDDDGRPNLEWRDVTMTKWQPQERKY